MNAERLLKVANLMDNLESYLLPGERFDMSFWYCQKPACGTVACAAGWAAAKLPELGLIPHPATVIGGVTNGEGDSTGEALSKCFDISDEDMDEIFYADAYRDDDEYDEVEVTPEMVAAKIRAFVQARQQQEIASQ